MGGLLSIQQGKAYIPTNALLYTEQHLSITTELQL
jgi:hypothetical protein